MTNSAPERSDYGTAPRGLEVSVSAFLVVLVACDMISPFWVTASWAGSLLWIAAHTALLLIGATALLTSLVRPVKFLSIIAIGMCAALLWISVSDPRNLSHESTQQVTCVLEKFSTPTHAFDDWCFLGYPARSYYVMALPTLAFGPSQGALNSGYIICFCIGLFAFWGGILALFKDRRGDIVALLTVALLLHSNHFNMLLLNFEQSFSPIAYSLMVCGFFLHYLATRRALFLKLTGLSLYLSIFAYTPALALSALALTLLPLFLLHPVSKGKRMLSAVLGLGILAGIVRSLWTRQDLKIKPRGGAEHVLLDKLNELWSALKVLTPPDGIVSPELAALGVAAFMFAVFVFVARGYFILTGRTNARGGIASTGLVDPYFGGAALFLLLSAWGVCVALISILSPGYAEPPPQYAIHRATLILPVLLSCAVVQLSKFKRFYLLQVPILLTLCCYLLYSGLWNIALHQERKPDDPKTVLFGALHAVLPGKKPNEELRLLMSNNVRWILGNTGDYASYFWPGIEYDFYEDCMQFEVKREERAPHAIVTEDPFPSCFRLANCEMGACKNFMALDHELLLCEFKYCGN